MFIDNGKTSYNLALANQISISVNERYYEPNSRKQIRIWFSGDEDRYEVILEDDNFEKIKALYVDIMSSFAQGSKYFKIS